MNAKWMNSEQLKNFLIENSIRMHVLENLAQNNIEC